MWIQGRIRVLKNVPRPTYEFCIFPQQINKIHFFPVTEQQISRFSATKWWISVSFCDILAKLMIFFSPAWLKIFVIFLHDRLMNGTIFSRDQTTSFAIFSSNRLISCFFCFVFSLRDRWVCDSLFYRLRKFTFFKQMNVFRNLFFPPAIE